VAREYLENVLPTHLRDLLGPRLGLEPVATAATLKGSANPAWPERMEEPK
jgi:hypothetical protein